MADSKFELEADQFEELRPITLGPVANEKGKGDGLTEEDWWAHVDYDYIWFKSSS